MDILKTALLEMCRKNKKAFFYPEDILKIMFPEDWDQFLPELKSLLEELLQEGEVVLKSKDPKIQFSELGNYSIKIKCNTKP